MIEPEINLTEQERDALDEISQRTGKSQAELIREAIDHLIAEFQKEDRRSLMQKARGIWKDRQDLPAFEELRREWNRL
ncbi:MAG TPA: ribbon-helix-helix protein, CopG family [Nitrososphaera sp.]|jgi:metal-responsive CopG/Arc/MetJ family transcriptional regulator|nr:ribbon-helix-helix protein, CopG family [Nitrososphaera sp.]